MTEDPLEVAVVYRREDALHLDAGFLLLVLVEQRERHVPHAREVFGGVSGSHPASVLVELHVEAPVKLVLNRPVRADRLGEAPKRRRRQRRHVVVRGLCALPSLPRGPFSLNADQRTDLAPADIELAGLDVQHLVDPAFTAPVTVSLLDVPASLLAAGGEGLLRV